MAISSELRPRVVLSADDDEDAHLLLKHAFAKAGAKSDLRQLNDGSEAIRYLAGEGEYADRNRFPLPDLLLLDLKMPTSGFRVLEYLIQHPKHRVCPIIVLSSSTHASDTEEARRLGCDAYKVKPCSFDELVEFVMEIDQGVPSGVRENSARDLTEHSRPIAPAPMRKESATEEGDSQPGEAYRSPEIFRMLVEQVKDYAIFLLDPNGIIRSWNEGARRINGYEADEIIGKHFSIFYPTADLETNKPGYELRMAREMGRYEEEGWRVRKDQSRFWANVTVTPLRDKVGQLCGYTKVTRDLTQSKLQEESFQRLLESEERFRLLVEQVRDYAIFMLDARGNVISWNQGARRIKGYTADEIIGKHFSTFYTEEALAKDHPAQELAIAMREGRYEEEGWRKRKDGSRFWANVVITALWDKRGNLTGFAKVTRDLTQKKEAEDALRHKNETLEAFAHTLSHDLRAPVRSISSFAGILGTEAAQLSESEKNLYLRKIQKAAESMNLMITEILNLSRITTVPAKQEPLPIKSILDDVLRLLESEIKSTSADVQVREPMPHVFGNRTLLMQIFSNLLTNALKFSIPGQKPKIELFASLGGDGDCTIHVRDQGIGVPETLQERIFTAFERGSAGNEIAGMGIGLAIVRKAAERQGGSVTLRSQPGQGSDFEVRLHCALEEAVPA